MGGEFFFLVALPMAERFAIVNATLSLIQRGLL